MLSHRPRVLLASTDAEAAREFSEALGDRFDLRLVRDVAGAIAAIRHFPPEVVVADNELPPYGAELLLSIVASLYPSVRRVLIASLPDETVAHLRAERIAHEVVGPGLVDHARVQSAVRGESRTEATDAQHDEHCAELLARLSDVARDAALRMEAARRAGRGAEWAVSLREAAALFRSAASHALALAEELDRVGFVECPACEGRGADCAECRGRGQLLRVRATT